MSRESEREPAPPPDSGPDATAPTVELPPDRPALGPSGIATSTTGLDDGSAPLPRMRAAPTAGVRGALERNRVMAGLFGEPAAAVKIGRFSVLHPIGAGGMGEIFAAYDPELDRKVAIKLVRSESRSSQAADRLYREAQTLARLSHPNVVQVYEVGRHEGQVFLAMEFVRGQDLQGWLASDQQRSWREALQVMIAAGRGLAAAHEAGLMHRDFKPANVLVGDDGQVRVIDFGLARSDEHGVRGAEGAAPELVTLDSGVQQRIGASASASLTMTGSILGTPAYMSPEQMEAQPTDRRSDQWSFCVALFEALYGERPFVGATMAELRSRILSDKRPLPPRGSPVPARIGHIIQRGLAVEPAARHESMDALLEQLERDPARRRRRLLGTALALATALGLGLLLAQWLLPEPAIASDPCAAAGHEIDEVWTPAISEEVRSAFAVSGVPYADDAHAAVSARVDRYLTDWRGERQRACEATHVRKVQTPELLELRSLCLDRRALRLRGLIDAWRRAEPAMVENAVRAADELPELASCADGELLRLGMRPPTDPEVAARVNDIRAQLAAGHAREYAGDYDGGIALAEQQAVEAARLEYAPVRAEALYLAGRLRILRSRDDDVQRGRAQLLQAVGLAESSRHDLLAARIWNTLTGLRAMDAPDAAERGRFSMRAVAAVARIGDRGLEFAHTVRNQGLLAFFDKDHEQAVAHLQRAIDLLSRRGGHPLMVAQYRMELGNALDQLGRTDDARTAHQQSMDELRAQLGPRHPRVATQAFNMGRVLVSSGEFDAARALLADLPATWTSLQGKSGRMVGQVHMLLADLEQQAGHLDAAERHARQALAIYELHYRQDNPTRLMQPVLVLSVIEYRRRQYEEALELGQEAIALYRGGLPKGADPAKDTTLAIYRNNLGEILIGLQRHREALDIFRDTEKVFARTKHPVLMALPHKGRGLAFLQQGQPTRAIASLERALESFRKHPGYPIELADTAWALAQALRASGTSPTRARELAAEARTIYRDHGPAGAELTQAIDAWLTS